MVDRGLGHKYSPRNRCYLGKLVGGGEKEKKKEEKKRERRKTLPEHAERGHRDLATAVDDWRDTKPGKRSFPPRQEERQAIANHVLLHRPLHPRTDE